MRPSGPPRHRSPDRKSFLRETVLERRRNCDATARQAADAARAARVIDAMATWLPGVVAAYASVDPEPGTEAILTILSGLGTRLLLPVLSGGPAKPGWAWWKPGDPWRSGAFGIPEPDSPPLEADAIWEAELFILPGLAGSTEGTRLGVGGGWYDRALAQADPGALRWLLLNDDEVMDSLPIDPWDQPVDAIFTETRWINIASSKVPDDVPIG